MTRAIPFAELGLAEPNYDESVAGVPALPPLITPEGRPARTAADRQACRARWLALFARHLYGPIPPRPDTLSLERRPLAGENCDHLVLELGVGRRRLRVDAALWLPPEREGPVPVIVALGFVGPAGILFCDAYPLDPLAVVTAPPPVGVLDGRLGEQVRGSLGYRFPVPLIGRAGYALILSCYGSWVPDDPARWRAHGLWPLLGLDDADEPPGALALWAWAYQRLVDVALGLPEIDPRQVALVGHSRLAKAALWAAANDTRVTDLLLNNSGCAGASLSRRRFGETLHHMRVRFPHWLTISVEAARDPAALPFDQHQLLACMAPRRLYVASASEDLWADPRGEYLSLKAAAPMWRISVAVPEIPAPDAVWTPGRAIAAGPLAWHLRPGTHEIMPWDWRRFLPFLQAGRPGTAQKVAPA